MLSIDHKLNVTTADSYNFIPSLPCPSLAWRFLHRPRQLCRRDYFAIAPLALCCSLGVVADFSEASGTFLFNVTIKPPIHFIGILGLWWGDSMSFVVLSRSQTLQIFPTGTNNFLAESISVWYWTSDKAIPFGPMVEPKPYTRAEPVIESQ